jgi:antitoxin (DNA-binding transcriptional repressor) of toxin-antitoxin stability system
MKKNITAAGKPIAQLTPITSLPELPRLILLTLQSLKVL